MQSPRSATARAVLVFVWAKVREERLRLKVVKAQNSGGTAGLAMASEILHQQVKINSLTARTWPSTPSPPPSTARRPSLHLSFFFQV